MKYLIPYLLIINAIGYLIMLVDKFLARRKLRRIPEKALWTIAAMGGSLGTYLGMLTCRHKTKHPSFYIGIPVLLALQCVVLFFALLRA